MTADPLDRDAALTAGTRASSKAVDRVPVRHAQAPV
jgi:hypothetical protein